MDEKQPRIAELNSAFAGPTKRSSSMSRRSFLISLLVSSALLIHLTHSSWRAILGHTHCPHHENRLTYPGERISWDKCGELANGRPLECSSIDVPMDQFNPENSGNKTFSIPLIRLRGKDATAKNLLLNPGGPGGSGVEFIYRKGELLSAIVGEGFHLLGFDPRGVNGSRPLASCYPDAEAQRRLAPVRDAKPLEDSPEIYAWAQNYARACEDTMGEHGKYIDTPQTAADMNSILEAVGQAGDLVYWGFSYGTILGQTYAGLFPESATRVIIDGVANQNDWYAGLDDFESLADTENVFDGFFDECIKAGPNNCSLASLTASGSKEELREKILSLAAGLQEQPLSVYVNNSNYGTLDYSKIMYNAIFPALYKPLLWYDLADRLAKLLQGNATEAFLAYGVGEAWDIVGDSNSFVLLNDGLTGPDHWPQDRQTILDKILPFFNSTIFGATQAHDYFNKQQWIIPQTHNYVPKNGVKTAHPLLILSTTYDPVCPLVSARSANVAFEGSQIVEVRGYGHCSVAVPSTCLAKHVRDFLYNGTLPSNYTQCDVDGPYFIKPEDDETKAAPRKHFDDAEEQRIHLAQVELARDSAWPRW